MGGAGAGHPPGMTQTPIEARPGPVSEGVVHDPPPDRRRERFEEVFGAHRDAVLGYLRRRTDSGHDAADLLADTFLVAWRRLDDLPPGNQTRPWLYGVARRVLANHRRGEGRRQAPVVSPETRRRRARPRLVLAAANLLIAGVVAATLVNRPGQDRPQALSFTEKGDKLIVRVVDPKADPKRYNAEFKRMGLDITVKAVAVSPPYVGRIVGHTGRNQQDLDQLRRLEPARSAPGP